MFNRRTLPYLWVSATILTLIVGSLTVFAFNQLTFKDSSASMISEVVMEDGRSYIIAAPNNADSLDKLPLVIALHGSGGVASVFADETGLNKLSASEKFISVTPQGIDVDGQVGWAAGNCCGVDTTSESDVNFVRNIILNIEDAYNVDTSRVFIVGFSNGGIMAYRLGCELSNLVTGVGVAAGSLGVNYCAPVKPVSLIHLHGSEDTTVPYRGGIGDSDGDVVFTPVLNSVQTFINGDGCLQDGLSLNVRDGVTTSWSGCKDGAKVSLTVFDGLKHAWFDNSGQIMWDFLKDTSRF